MRLNSIHFSSDEWSSKDADLLVIVLIFFFFFFFFGLFSVSFKADTARGLGHFLGVYL